MFTDADGINWFLTALLNPSFLLVLLLTYFLGKFLGKLTVNLNVWKVLALCYLGLFFLEPLSQLSILTLIFGLGVLSNHRRLILSVFGWAQNLGDVIYAFRHRRAFDDIRRREEELDERERAFRQEEARFRREQEVESGPQQRWREEAKQRRKPKQKSKDTSGGGSSSAGSGRDRSSTSSHQSKARSSPEDERDGYLIILGLKPGRSYTRDDYKRAYRRKARETHPDAGGSSGAFIEVQKAYEWLRLS